MVVEPEVCEACGVGGLGVEIEQIAWGCWFTEGPVGHPNGEFLICSDVSANARRRWNPGDGYQRLGARPIHKANGMTLDAERCLIVCEHEESNITSAPALGGFRRPPPNHQPSLATARSLDNARPEEYMGIEGKVAVVTGGAGGIGRGIAQCLLQAGARVVVASRTTADLEETRRLLSPFGDITTKVCDVSDSSAVGALMEHSLARFGALDILACSHGVHHPGHSILDHAAEAWHQTIAVNLTGTFLCGQAAARAMVERGCKGRIINVSSTAALASVANECAYDASKGGVQALTRAMSLDLAEYGITVNAVAPGFIKTRMIRSPDPEAVGPVVNPLGRLGAPEDVGTAVVWLADPQSSYVTGTTLVVDGGQHASLGFGAKIDTSSLRR